jgi:hydroxypyruvate reductase
VADRGEQVRSTDAADRPPQVETLLGLYRAALAAADPRAVVPGRLPDPPAGRTVVVGLGKAAAAMAQSVEAHWPGPLQGAVVVPRGAALPLRHLRVIEASHPVPDESSVRGARALLGAVAGLHADDLVIALVSGGGSSLCALPPDGVALEDKQRITRALLARGATIHEMNTVRRHLSAIKGGRLAAAAFPARVVTLVISDIPGDDPAQVASGPTIASAATAAQALAVLRRYEVEAGEFIVERLGQGGFDVVAPGDPRLANHRHDLVASAWTALDSAATAARAAGFDVHVLGDAIEGEARSVAQVHAGIVQSILRHGAPFRAPCVLLSGGEATVTLKGRGRGGRNTEFALALALALEAPAAPGCVWALSAGTDGLDGSAGAAGAWIAPDTLERARAAGLKPRDMLDDNDSGTFFERLGALVHTGPTHTNVNDLRALIVSPPVR